MNRNAQVYRLMGIDTAMQLLRPGASWEISNNRFTRWEDERPCPSIEEVYWVIDKIKEFEDTIPTIYTNEQLETLNFENNQIKETLKNAE